MGGLWAVTAPFLIFRAARRKRWLLAALYLVPAAWFLAGYIAVTLAK
jgi:hypothetical protein